MINVLPNRITELRSPLETQSVTIVVAALNEGDNLQPFLQAIAETFVTLGFQLPVLLIDDGSTDHSGEVLARLQDRYSFLQVIHHPQPSGLTQVLKTALRYAQSDWLYCTAADLESDIRTDLPRLLQAWQPGVDAVAGWRQGRNDGKNLASAIANLTCRTAFGLQIHDMNWVKLVRRDVLEDLPLSRITHRFILAIMAALGYRIVETPTVWHSRKAGKSKFGRRRLWSSAREFWQLWWWFQTQRQSLLALRKRAL